MNSEPPISRCAWVFNAHYHSNGMRRPRVKSSDGKQAILDFISQGNRLVINRKYTVQLKNKNHLAADIKDLIKQKKAKIISEHYGVKYKTQYLVSV